MIRYPNNVSKIRLSPQSIQQPPNKRVRFTFKPINSNSNIVISPEYRHNVEMNLGNVNPFEHRLIKIINDIYDQSESEKKIDRAKLYGVDARVEEKQFLDDMFAATDEVFGDSIREQEQKRRARETKKKSMFQRLKDFFIPNVNPDTDEIAAEAEANRKEKQERRERYKQHFEQVEKAFREGLETGNIADLYSDVNDENEARKRARDERIQRMESDMNKMYAQFMLPAYLYENARMLTMRDMMKAATGWAPPYEQMKDLMDDFALGYYDAKRANDILDDSEPEKILDDATGTADEKIRTNVLKDLAFRYRVSNSIEQLFPFGNVSLPVKEHLKKELLEASLELEEQLKREQGEAFKPEGFLREFSQVISGLFPKMVNQKNWGKAKAEDFASLYRITKEKKLLKDVVNVDDIIPLFRSGPIEFLRKRYDIKPPGLNDFHVNPRHKGHLASYDTNYRFTLPNMLLWAEKEDRIARLVKRPLNTTFKLRRCVEPPHDSPSKLSEYELSSQQVRDFATTAARQLFAYDMPERVEKLQENLERQSKEYGLKKPVTILEALQSFEKQYRTKLHDGDLIPFDPRFYFGLNGRHIVSPDSTSDLGYFRLSPYDNDTLFLLSDFAKPILGTLRQNYGIED